MPSEVIIPLISGLVGALIGSAGTVAVVLIQTRSEDRRERRRLAIEAAIAEYNTVVATRAAAKMGGTVATLASYVHYYDRLFKLMDEGNLDRASKDTIMQENLVLFPGPDKAQKPL